MSSTPSLPLTPAAQNLDADDARVLAHLTVLALAAGDEIMRHFSHQTPASHKSDGSPVTAADVAAEAIIVEGLQQHFGHIACVAEEAMAAGNGPTTLGCAFFLIDALDGTREFLASRDEFTVNIALVRDHMPTVGVVYAPAQHALFTGVVAQRRAIRYHGSEACARVAAAAKALIAAPAEAGEDSGAALEGAIGAIGAIGTCITVRPPPVPPTPPSVVVSRSRSSEETRAFIARFPGASVERMGSSLKFCAIAAGNADWYPCFGRTMEWDTAAGHAVLMAAGGRVTLENGESLTYGKRDQARMSVDTDVDADFTADYANRYFVASA